MEDTCFSFEKSLNYFSPFSKNSHAKNNFCADPNSKFRAKKKKKAASFFFWPERDFISSAQWVMAWEREGLKRREREKKKVCFFAIFFSCSIRHALASFFFRSHVFVVKRRKRREIFLISVKRTILFFLFLKKRIFPLSWHASILYCFMYIFANILYCKNIL